MKASVRILAATTLLIAGIAPGVTWSGEDVAGAKDHPLLSRYPDSFITEYTKNYDAIEFQVGPAARSRKRRPAKSVTTAIVARGIDAARERGGIRPGETRRRQSHRGRPRQEPAR
jgi:hypothetical protein